MTKSHGWIALGVVLAFGFRLWTVWFTQEPSLPGWQWASAGFLCGANLGLWLAQIGMPLPSAPSEEGR